MQSLLNRSDVGEQTDRDLFDELWQRIRQRLEAEKERIYQEISYYPPPIPACDAQFNGLLEERATVLQELDRVNEIRNERLSAEEQVERLGEFVQSSRHLGSEVAESIRQSLSKLPI